jgi:hypothetical protein
MLEGTFQLGEGFGPARERALWHAGIATWEDLARGATDAVRGEGRQGARGRDAPLLARVSEVRTAMERGDVKAVAGAIPSREHWRLLPALDGRVAYLDIETDAAGAIIAIGFWGPRGPVILLPEGRSAQGDLESFPEALGGVDALVTFNGAAFDLPRLCARFSGWEPPPVHIDVCHLWRRLGHRGGLKALERAQGIERPRIIATLDDAKAAHLWREGAAGQAEALQRFAAYNLADAAHLRILAPRGYNLLSQSLGRAWPHLPVPERGDMLYDLSQALLALRPAPHASASVPAAMPTRLV